MARSSQPPTIGLADDEQVGASARGVRRRSPLTRTVAQVRGGSIQIVPRAGLIELIHITDQPFLGVDAPPPEVEVVDGATAAPGETEGFLPDGLACRPEPEAAPPRVPWRRPAIEGERLLGRPHYVIPPDTRQAILPTAYPWTAMGLVSGNANSYGTGVMVGPRHVLTSSHLFEWDAAGKPRAMGFTAAYRTGNTPFGTYMFEKVYVLRKVVPDVNGLLDATDMAYDLAVGVLPDAGRIGPFTGWLPTAGWLPIWGSPGVARHLGYSAGVWGGEYPLYVKGGTVSGTTPDFTHLVEGRELFHDLDAEVGNSGGPVFAWATGPLLPSTAPVVFGVQSAELVASTKNVASGGTALPLLVSVARFKSP